MNPWLPFISRLFPCIFYDIKKNRVGFATVCHLLTKKCFYFKSLSDQFCFPISDLNRSDAGEDQKNNIIENLSNNFSCWPRLQHVIWPLDIDNKIWTNTLIEFSRLNWILLQFSQGSMDNLIFSFDLILLLRRQLERLANKRSILTNKEFNLICFVDTSSEATGCVGSNMHIEWLPK